MKRVATTLLLGLALAVTSYSQIGIHLKSNGNVGICDETPFTHLTVNGPIGFNNGDYPMHYMFESGESNTMRAVFAHSPAVPGRGIFYSDSLDNFKFGNLQGEGVWMSLTQPAVGIGYRNPTNGLVIAGTQGHTPVLRLGSRNGFDSPNAGMILFDEDVDAATGPDNFCGMAIRYNGATNQLEILGDCAENTSPENANLVMALSRAGSIGLGTSPAETYRLQVDGKVRSKEVVVETGWADYVFDASYDLPTLDEVATYIDSYKHLPGIPAAREVEEQGLEVGEMSALMMAKIEELTLYTIEQQRLIDEQAAELRTLRQQVEQLSARSGNQH